MLRTVIFPTHVIILRTSLANRRKNAMVSPASLSEGRVWTLLTHGFSHRDGMHLIVNSLGIYMFGSVRAWWKGGININGVCMLRAPSARGGRDRDA